MLWWSLFLFWAGNVQTSNILLISPFPSWSHQESFILLSDELSKRGHNVTFMTTTPPKETLRNWTSIDLSSIQERLSGLREEFGFSVQRESNSAFFFTAQQVLVFRLISEHIFSIPHVQEFIRTTNKSSYDVVILNDLTMASFSGLVHLIGTPPVIGITTLPNFLPSNIMTHVPINPSFMPGMNTGYTDKMNFFQRVYNTIYYWWIMYVIDKRIIPIQDEIKRKYFGNEAPSAWDFERNKSIVLKLTDLTLNYPVPMPPNVIQIGPIHIKQSGPLPKELKEWCDGAEDGVVYFSMGSQMKVTSLKEETRDSFMKAFAKFPKIRFLFKWESDESIPHLPNNVLTKKWFPQQDIFGHKNVRLFITHGGLKSLEEAIHHGVPVLSIPLFADQTLNTQKMVKEGAGIRLEMSEISPDSAYNALKRILYEEKDLYKNNASRLSNIARHQIVPAMDAAIWWIEYVIRHKGARHLRMASFDLSPYQLALIDVYAFLIAMLLIFAYGLFFIVKYIILDKIVKFVIKKRRKVIGNRNDKSKIE